MSALPAAPVRALKGYAPLLAVLVAVAAFTTFVPTTGRETTTTAATGALGGALTDGGGALGPGGTNGGPGGPTGTGEPGAPGSPTGPGQPGAPGASTGQPGAGDGTPGAGPASNGPGCADRVLQIPGDPYSPPCIDFTGDNGGATAPGVTADSVVVSWRLTDDTALAGAIAASVGNRIEIGDTADDVRRTIEALTEYFNRNFELYGRRIDMRIYDGRGKFQDELLGSGQDAATADAITVAEEIGAFAEALGNTTAYADGLARRGVIAIGLEQLSEEWYAERHPYVWGTVSCTTIAHQLAEYANQRLFGRPATWAGGDLAGQPRRIGIVAPENPYYRDCVDTLVADLEAQGNHLAANLIYRLDINTVSQDTSTIVARLAEERITTVLCFTEAVSPVFYTAKAAQQRYQPEWVIAGIAGIDLDAAGQQYDPDQWSRAFGIRTLGDLVPLEARRSYQAFKSVRPDQEPAGFSVDTIYESLYELAVGIQLAGPNLTPETFAAGYRSYPGGSGIFGRWRGEADSHTWLRDTQEVWWNPNATSTDNGAPGAYIPSSPRFEIGQWPAGDPAVFGS